MAVAHDAVFESHTGTTGSSNEASFSWTHTPTGTPGGVLVYAFVDVNLDLSTSVTYGGVNLTAVAGGFAQDTVGEAGSCRAWFRGSGLPTGAQTVTVNRTNVADIMYAVSITVTAAGATETFGVTLQQEDQAPAEASITDGSPGTNSVRYAGAHYGGSNIPPPGANSTALVSIDYGLFTQATARETNAGQGSRLVGFAAASDDWACVLLAVREVPAAAFIPYSWVPRIGPILAQ